MLIKLNAYDTLFFRDGRNFTAGEDFWANSLFPPPPSVIYGALRTTWFAGHPDQFQRLVDSEGEDDPTKNLKVNRIVLAYNNKPHFPVPGDIVCQKDDKETGYLMVSQPISEDMVADYRFQYCFNPPFDKEIESVEDSYLSQISFADYLKGNAHEFNLISKADIITDEYKIGIGRNRTTGTVHEGLLYRVGMVRLPEAGIMVDFDNLRLPAKGLMRLGGEGKAVHYQETSALSRVMCPEINDVFKLVINTPAIFEKGWLPQAFDEQSLTGSWKNIEMEIINAAVGNYMSIGGWDMLKGEPKPMYRAVPPGSVYYIRLKNSDAEALQKAFHGQCISDIYPEQGFGLSYLGGIKL